MIELQDIFNNHVDSFISFQELFEMLITVGLPISEDCLHEALLYHNINLENTFEFSHFEKIYNYLDIFEFEDDGIDTTARTTFSPNKSGLPCMHSI